MIQVLQMKKYNLENRFDLLTGEVLECKSPESYHLQSFKDKRNMKKFFLKAMENKTPEVIQKFIFDVYKGYCDLKKIEYAPSFAETLSIKVLPHAETVNNYYKGGYSQLIIDLKLKSFLKYTDLKFPINKIPNDITIIQDTREKTAANTGFNTIIKKLDFGDYSIERENQIAVVERKTSNDAWGTLSTNTNFERFCREMERAKAANKYVIILIESTFNNAK